MISGGVYLSVSDLISLGVIISGSIHVDANGVISFLFLSSIRWWWWFSHSVASNSRDPMDYIRPGSCVHGILQARTLEWVAIR